VLANGEKKDFEARKPKKVERESSGKFA
jgi:hypothetical protein